MRAIRIAALLTGAAAGGHAAMAAPVELGGSVAARAGYGTNPFLRIGQNLGSPIVGGRIAPTLTYTSGTATTQLNGTYDREEYLRRYGSAETISGVLSHRQQVSERLSVDGRVGYSSSTNPYIGGISDQDLIDPLAIGTRTRRLFAGGNFTLRTSGTNGLTGGANVAHTTFKRASGLGNYDFYNGYLGYTHRVSAKTQVGATVSATRTTSDRFPGVEAIQPGITLVQQLAPNWSFNGGLGVIFQRGGGGTATSLGFNAALCGTYPLTSICVRASRQTSASGIGGGRTNLTGSVNVTQRLSDFDTITGYLTYTDSNSVAAVRSVGQRVMSAGASYDRRLSPRLSAGLDGRYQTRSIGLLGNARSAAITANVKLLIGRSRT